MKARVLISAMVIALFAALGTGTDDTEGDQSASKSRGTKPSSRTPDIAVPARQEAFSKAVTQFYKPYRSASNELKKSVLRTKRKGLIRAALGKSRKFKDWVGTIDGLQTNSEGKAVLSIKLVGSGVQLKTWNNALSDIGDDTLIDQSASLFATIAEMKEGSRVKVSGSLIKADKDYVKESSLSEHGSMTDPEFIVKFSAVRAH